MKLTNAPAGTPKLRLAKETLCNLTIKSGVRTGLAYGMGNSGGGGLATVTCRTWPDRFVCSRVPKRAEPSRSGSHPGQLGSSSRTAR